jgi:hypothetical protein
MLARAVRAILVLPVLLASISSAEEGVIRSARSGAWSEGQTWDGGKVPAAGARVLILGGHSVTYDVTSDDVVRTICVSGMLTFARDRDTRLNVGLVTDSTVKGISTLPIPASPEQRSRSARLMRRFPLLTKP